MKVLFAHGFEGVPNGRKARYLRDTLSLNVVAPLMNQKGWTFEDHIAVVEDALAQNPDLETLVGSSMGAFAIAAAVARHRQRKLRLVLLAPAVGIHQAWIEQLGEDGMKLWAEMGSLQYHHQGVGHHVELPYHLFTQCREAAEVICTHPTVIVHGLRDDVVPVESALALARRSPGVRRMYAVDDGHRLLDSLPLLGEAIELLGTPR